MGGVYLSKGKNGGSILRRRKKWGEDTLAAEGHVVMHTPPLRVFGRGCVGWLGVRETKKATFTRRKPCLKCPANKHLVF